MAINILTPPETIKRDLCFKASDLLPVSYSMTFKPTTATNRTTLGRFTPDQNYFLVGLSMMGTTSYDVHPAGAAGPFTLMSNLIVTMAQNETAIYSKTANGAASQSLIASAGWVDNNRMSSYQNFYPYGKYLLKGQTVYLYVDSESDQFVPDANSFASAVLYLMPTFI